MSYDFQAFGLTANGGGSYTIFHSYSDTYPVSDNGSDGPGDSTTILGDITPDHFLIFGEGTPFTYVGAGDGGFVATSFGGLFYLYSNNISTNTFTVSQDAFNLQTEQPVPVCFATGTLIKTARGEVAVEDLREGEGVITASGEARAIQWIGHRRTDCAKHPRPKDVWPVLVEAGALGNATPERDLYLTPYHAVALTCGSEVLVPIHCLINGTTIRQVPVDEITYWHVELETHDILVANGAAAESYLDTGNRAGFENADGPTDLHPDFKPADDADFCRPLVTSGPILAALRASLPQSQALIAA